MKRPERKDTEGQRIDVEVINESYNQALDDMDAWLPGKIEIHNIIAVETSNPELGKILAKAIHKRISE